MMTGMYLTFWLFQTFGIDPYLSILITGPALFIFGAVVYRFLLDPMRGKALQNQFLVTLGLSLFLTNAAQVIFSPDFRTIQTAYGQDVIQIGPAFIPLTRIFTFAVAVAATGLLLLIFQQTRLGRSIRAVAQQQDGAALMRDRCTARLHPCFRSRERMRRHCRCCRHTRSSTFLPR